MRLLSDISLQRLPTTVVDIGLQLAGNKAGDPVTEPQVPQERVVPLLVEEQLATVAEAHVHLAVLVDIRGVGEGAALPVQHEDDAPPNIQKETYRPLASVLVLAYDSSLNIVTEEGEKIGEVKVGRHTWQDAGSPRRR